MYSSQDEDNEFDFTNWDGKIANFLDNLFPFINIIGILITGIIMLSIIPEIIHIGAQLWCVITQPKYEFDSSEPILKVIELLFLSTIPLLITTGFYKYFRKVIVNVFRFSRRSGPKGTLETLKSSLDLAMTKYNFYSILISTGFIILFRKINNISPIIAWKEIVLYFLMIVAIIFLLYFIIKLKHSIVEGGISIIKQEQEVDKFYEIFKAEKHIAELKDKIAELHLEKNNLDIDIASMKKSRTKRVGTGK